MQILSTLHLAEFSMKSKTLSSVLAVIFFVVGVLFIAIFVSPYEMLKSIGDFLSSDGNLESLTPEWIVTLKSFLLPLGIFLSLIGSSIWMRPGKARVLIEKGLSRIRQSRERLLEDGRALLNDVWGGRPDRTETIGLIAIVILAIVLRLAMITRPAEYDEAYTFIAFARHSFRQILIDYNVPNNHIFHTILVRLSYLMFGSDLWQIRLPTFMASILLVISAYFLGRNLYNRKSGIIGAILAATLPSLVVKSVSARGYIIVTLMMVVALLAGNYVIQKKNISGWIILAFSCAIGFFTVPVMIFPCGFIFIWLFSLGPAKQYHQDYGSLFSWMKYLFCAGFLLIFMVMLLYLPVVLNINTGRAPNIHNFLYPIPFREYIASAPTALGSLILEWRSGVNGLLFFILIAGFIFSLILNKSISKQSLPMSLVLIVYILAAILIIKPPSIFLRIWIWILPLLLMWSAAGIVGALDWAATKFSKPYISHGLTGILVLGVAVNGIVAIRSASLTGAYTQDPAVIPVTAFLKSRIANDDLVIVSSCSNARYWYYFYKSDIPDQVIRNRKRPFADVYVIVYTESSPACGNETLETVLTYFGPKSDFLDMSKVDLIFNYDYASVYQIGTFPDRIQREYPAP